MNYFAHALPFLDRPYFLAGTAVPDWLTVADRKVRLRSKHVEVFLDDADPCVAAVASGVLSGLAPGVARTVTHPAAPATAAAPKQHEIETVLGGGAQ